MRRTARCLVLWTPRLTFLLNVSVSAAAASVEFSCRLTKRETIALSPCCPTVSASAAAATTAATAAAAAAAAATAAATAQEAGSFSSRKNSPASS